MTESIHQLETGIPDPMPPVVTPQAPKPWLPAWLTAQVPEGDDWQAYLDNPLNITRSEGLAMVLCGLKHILGGVSLRYAVMYVVTGLWRMIRWRPGPGTQGESAVSRDGEDIIIHGRPPGI